MKQPVRITKKYRVMSAITEAIEELVLEQEDCCPSVGLVSNMITDNSLSPDANSAIRSMLLDEVTNDVTRYFQEACKIVSEENQDIPYHFITSKYYSKKYRTPETPEEARRYVAMFGGGGGGVQGCRFLNDYEEASSDHMYAVYMEGICRNSNDRSKAAADKFLRALNKGVLKHPRSAYDKLPVSVKAHLAPPEKLLPAA